MSKGVPAAGLQPASQLEEYQQHHMFDNRGVLLHKRFPSFQRPSNRAIGAKSRKNS